MAALFLKLGITGFGGPAAHIAMMHDEAVVRRKWLSDGQFLDLVGATNLIPGPNSTEMAIHVGFLRAGWPGLIAGGVCFILPAMLIVMGLAWAYVRFGSTPQAEWLLYGVKPVIIAIIVRALWSLGSKAVKNPLLAGVGLDFPHRSPDHRYRVRLAGAADSHQGQFNVADLGRSDRGIAPRSFRGLRLRITRDIPLLPRHQE